MNTGKSGFFSSFSSLLIIFRLGGQFYRRVVGTLESISHLQRTLQLSTRPYVVESSKSRMELFF
ncbi:hypothetical protein BCY86_05270 [Pajaroellobacter abortibovis]|uniref:Uncharacterized protein n=1 Tax=Pajaroellobacter abortibovis TaxID=1882918 RepID=A0A1L6MXH9_9BACT|nr:hypothetical protein BCY86_05270 [Pajaroellobacter abortibovis]